MNELENKNSTIFVTSDHHFWHKNIIRFAERPFESIEEMNEKMIFYWNEIVRPFDVVFHCGDLCLGTKDDCREIINRLNGKILLIRGNHDRSKEFYNSINNKIQILPNGYKMQIAGNNDIHGIIFSHRPMPLKNIPKDYINCHGHIHSTFENKKFNHYPHIDVGVDRFNFQPMKIKDLLYMKLKEF